MGREFTGCGRWQTAFVVIIIVTVHHRRKQLPKLGSARGHLLQGLGFHKAEGDAHAARVLIRCRDGALTKSTRSGFFESGHLLGKCRLSIYSKLSTR